MTSTTDSLLHDRSAHLAKNLSVLYPDSPIHVVRGSGQFLYDADGLDYLDCMNNVPHVGHSNPVVNAAITAQLDRVNTNTRFLYQPIVDYANKLTSLLPGPLEVCFFVNSGSEANELALRLVKTHTHRRGITVLDGAYHGNTTSLVDISPYKFNGRGGIGRQPFVEVAPTPDSYRGIHRDLESGESYALEVSRALERNANAGYAPAAYISEAIMGTAGQIVPPTDFVPAAYRYARQVGALVVADEVQIGFGRVGTHMWSFESLGGEPDIVTFGKPIGNGFPLGAVVTTREIAESFANGMEYFNTFGGSPVACAAGMAVLQVIEDENLQQHAKTVGDRLLLGLTELSRQHQAIGDARGRGLFLGVEFVTDPTTREPDPSRARDVVQALRRQRILISTDGPQNNVLKIKPPLPFTTADADRLVEAIDTAMKHN
jgi:4-aminobutyrate aminotransferase-like enzyme